MNKNRMAGAGKKVAGGAKAAIGKALGNRKLQAKGAVERAVGSAQNAFGKAQDKFGKVIKK